MHHLPGLDAYLTPPDPIEVELVDAECGECGTVQDVSTYSNSDEADWECRVDEHRLLRRRPGGRKGLVMIAYMIEVTRVTTYEVEAESDEQAWNVFAEGLAREVDETTLEMQIVERKRVP